MNGSIKSQASVRSAKGSKVKGDIFAEEAQIHGLVEGNLIIKGKILLGNESQVTGNLKSGTLVIEEGASFNGLCGMNSSQIKNKKVANLNEGKK